MNCETLYTFIMEYAGGTYISQVRSSDLDAALLQWTAKLSSEDLNDWGLSRAVLEDAVREDPPVPLKGLTNIWCIFASAGKNQLLVNIVATI